MWEFVGGKVRQESPEGTLYREFKKTGLSVTQGK